MGALYTCSDAPTVLELNGLSFKKKDLAIQPLTEMMKLQQSGKRNNCTPYGGLFFQAKQSGKDRGNAYFLKEVQGFTHQKIGSSNQDQTDRSFLGKEIIRSALPTEGMPRQQVWVDNMKAPAMAKSL